MELRELGRMEYGACLRLMRELKDARIRCEGQDTLLVVEHPPVATLGRRGTPAEVFDPSLPVFAIERGGQATYHAPGQLVLYPIVHLGDGFRDVRAWVRHLEALVIRMLGGFGIAAHARPETPGVWTASGKKIASIGIALQHWVSFHGIAVNVSIEPKEFERIDPCGLGAAVMTSMVREGVVVTMDDVQAWVREHAVAHLSAFAPRAQTGRA